MANENLKPTVLLAAVFVAAFAGTWLYLNRAPARPVPPPTDGGQVENVPETEPKKQWHRRNEKVTGPGIEFDQKNFDFGKVMGGELVPFEFTYTNNGTEALNISKVERTCGCTITGEWSRNVKPGETGSIPIVLHTEKFDGRIEKLIKVHSNAVNMGKVDLWMRGIVQQPIAVFPLEANLGVVVNQEVPTRRHVRILNRLKKPLEILSVESDDKQFGVKLKTVKPGVEYELEVYIVPPLNYGGLTAAITMQTNLKEKPAFKVQAYCYVPEPVAVNPNEIRMPAGPLPDVMSRTVVVSSSKVSDLEVSDVLFNSDEVKVQCREKIPGRRWRIDIEFPKGFVTPEDGLLSLSFKTNHAYKPSVDIPVKFIRRNPVPSIKSVPFE